MSKNMNVFVIYKQVSDRNTGEVESVEIIEPCSSEKEAHSFSRLYNLQIPNDSKGNVSYQHLRVAVNKSSNNRQEDMFIIQEQNANGI